MSLKGKITIILVKTLGNPQRRDYRKTKTKGILLLATIATKRPPYPCPTIAVKLY